MLWHIEAWFDSLAYYLLLCVNTQCQESCSCVNLCYCTQKCQGFSLILAAILKGEQSLHKYCPPAHCVCLCMDVATLLQKCLKPIKFRETKKSNLKMHTRAPSA